MIAKHMYEIIFKIIVIRFSLLLKFRFYFHSFISKLKIYGHSIGSASIRIQFPMNGYSF